MRPQLNGRFEDQCATGAGALGSGHRGPHKHFLSKKPPEVSGPEGRLARKSRGKLLSPCVFPQLPRSPWSLLWRRFPARPSCRLEEAPLSFPEEGVPWELREAQRVRVKLIRDVNGDFGNLLLPPAAAAALLRCRLQVEKSPVGRKGSGSFQGRPRPEILDDWNLRRQALCALESRVSAAAAPEPAHLWPRRGAPWNQLWPPPAPSPFRTDPAES